MFVLNISLLNVKIEDINIAFVVTNLGVGNIP